jgi:hypothetical protein
MNRRTGTFCAAALLFGACGAEIDVSERSKYPTATEHELKGVVRTTLDHPNPTPAQLARRERSIAVLKNLGVPYLATLPVTESETAIVPRSAKEIADRAVAVAIAAVKGETNDQEFVEDLVTQYQADTLFTPQEKAFIVNPSPQRQDLIDHAWRYEAVHVLLWALGHIEGLKGPNEICEVSRDVGTIRDLGRDGLASTATPRSMAALLEQADLYYHLHWSAIELRIRGRHSDALDEGIIRERHRALNWLTRYMGQEWDDVETDT